MTKTPGLTILAAITQERDEQAGHCGLEDTNVPAPVEPFLNKKNEDITAIGGWVITKVEKRERMAGIPPWRETASVRLTFAFMMA